MWQAIASIAGFVMSLIVGGITAASRGKWKERSKQGRKDLENVKKANQARDDARRDINAGGLRDDDGYRRD